MSEYQLIIDLLNLTICPCSLIPSLSLLERESLGTRLVTICALSYTKCDILYPKRVMFHQITLPLIRTCDICAYTSQQTCTHDIFSTTPSHILHSSHTHTSSLGAEPAGPAVTGTFRNKRWPVDCPVAGCKGEKGARGDIGPMGRRVRE